MGTSSIYGGPPNSNPKDNPLLPNDFDFDENDKHEEDATEEGNNEEDDNSQNEGDTEENNTEESDPPKEVSWRDAKNYMAKLASGTYKDKRRAVSNHIKAYGGAKAASKTAKSGVGTVIGLGNFANKVNSSSFRTTLEEYNIDYKDKSPREVLNELTNLIAPVPITKDDSIARKALILTLEYIYEMLDEENMDYDSIDKNAFNLMIPKFIENYIYERIINDLGSRIELNSDTPQEAMSLETELKEYINAKVEIAFKGKDFSKINFNDATTQNKVESLINQCYTLMEE
ncbi:Qat anti-phage system associated protein QatB [Winogradskyella sediminis]|uniref:Qat anti-phage system associated protein QatB n=1 Tax=Winogradskyella sediminis TaxID=1382466 RepID=UPI003AA85406